MAAPAPIELAVDTVRVASGTMRASPRQASVSGPNRVVAARPRARKRGMIAIVFGWLAVLGAIALLVYVGSFVFKRPDPHKHPKATGIAAPAPTP